MAKDKKKKGPLRWILSLLMKLVLLVIILAVALVATLTMTEYKPADEEKLMEAKTYDQAFMESENLPEKGSTVKVVSWNIGYGALGDNADFFMDGGKSVTTADKGRVKTNMEGIVAAIASFDADYLLLQEVDRDSRRSSHIDEEALLKDRLSTYTSNFFANNFNVLFVPYPWPPIGKVDSGLLLMSKYAVTDASRLSLPCPFKWPVSTCNLKRGIIVSRTPVKGTEKVNADGTVEAKELVVIDLHLEAYDDGEGKKAQTERLQEIMAQEQAKGNYVIAGGDFNQTFSNVDATAYPVYEGRWQPGLMDVDEFGASGWNFVMDNKTPTCRSLDRAYDKTDLGFQYYMIDGFIVSDNLEIKTIETQNLEFEDTDHNPVLLEVTIK